MLVQLTSVKLNPLASTGYMPFDCAVLAEDEYYTHFKTLKSLILPAECCSSPYQQQINKKYIYNN